ncbi:MAG TPA: iron-containing alcohol dehydrogenase, partial [bacterium]
MHFEFAIPSRVVFGIGASKEIGKRVQTMGKRVLAAVDQHTAAAMDLVSQMERVGLGIEVVEVSGEPSTVFVEEAASLARARRCDLAVGIGGGSAMDTAKAVAALLSNDDLFEYLE